MHLSITLVPAMCWQGSSEPFFQSMWPTKNFFFGGGWGNLCYYSIAGHLQLITKPRLSSDTPLFGVKVVNSDEIVHSLGTKKDKNMIYCSIVSGKKKY